MLLDLIFPKKCVGCKGIGSFFCDSCIQEIRQKELICPSCRRASIGGVVHPVCQRKYGLDGLWSLGLYEKPLKTAIQKLKYKRVKLLAEDLVNLTVDYWARNQPFLLDEIKKDRGESWVVVPVPLHKSRENWRGFNQSALFGQILAERIGLKYQNVLVKAKNTKPQVGLEAHERRENIKSASSLSNLQTLSSKNIILVDDVWTTGATMKECCFVLKRSGAKRVWGLTLAR